MGISIYTFHNNSRNKDQNCSFSSTSFFLVVNVFASFSFFCLNFFWYIFVVRPQSISGVAELTDMLERGSHWLQLIDFGRSIDMTMFPAGTTFMVKTQKKDHQCIEMKTNRPWTYQVKPQSLIQI